MKIAIACSYYNLLLRRRGDGGMQPTLRILKEDGHALLQENDHYILLDL